MSIPTRAANPRGHRIKRKPPPVIDVAERYPSPDPLDPFAPLWVLRNRTSSALQVLPEHDTLNDLIEQGRSNAYLYSTATTQISTLVNTSITSPATPPNKRVIGHYRPHSQIKLVNSAQTFPIIASPVSSKTDPSSLRQGWSLVNQRRLSTSPDPVDTPDSSGTESDSSLPARRVKSGLKKPSSTSGTRVRLPRFLSPRRPSSSDSQNSHSTSTTSTTIQSKVLDTKRVPEPSISLVYNVTCDSEAQNDTTLVSLTDGTPVVNDSTSLALDNNNPLLDATIQTDDIKDDVEDWDRLCSSDTECTTTTKKPLKRSQIRPHTAPGGIPRMPRGRRFSSAPITPTSPRQSVSSSSIVNISTPSPLSFTQSSEDAYNLPRHAPQPSHTSPPNFKTSNSTSCTPPDQPFPSEWDLPTDHHISQAASLPITAENGTRISFGSLFATQRTIVIFIRHFWCPLCQDYMSAVKSHVKPEMLHVLLDEEKRREEIKLAIISNGAYGMIAKYRQIFGLPFDVYTDPLSGVYNALGMGRDSLNSKTESHQHSESVDAGLERPSADFFPPLKKDCQAQAEELGSKRGGYTKRGVMGGIATVVMRAIKVRMPVWEKGGDVRQLGGEFVFGPGLTCRFAHRMKTTKGHAPVEDVLRAAGIFVPGPELLSLELEEGWGLDNDFLQRRRRESMETIPENTAERRGTNRGSGGSRCGPSSPMTLEEEAEWMVQRQRNLERIREKKNARRGILNQPLNLHPAEKSLLDVSESSGSARSGTEDDHQNFGEDTATLHSQDSHNTRTNMATSQKQERRYLYD